MRGHTEWVTLCLPGTRDWNRSPYFDEAPGTVASQLGVSFEIYVKHASLYTIVHSGRESTESSR